MAERATWEGSASDFLHIADARRKAMVGHSTASVGWPRNPRALAGRLRRVQTFLRALGIEIIFSREGRTGTQLITMRAAPLEPSHAVQYRTVSAVSTVSSFRLASLGGSGPPIGFDTAEGRSGYADDADAKKAKKK